MARIAHSNRIVLERVAATDSLIDVLDRVIEKGIYLDRRTRVVITSHQSWLLLASTVLPDEPEDPPPALAAALAVPEPPIFIDLRAKFGGSLGDRR